MNNYSKKYCPDLHWEGNIETGHPGTLIENSQLDQAKCQDPEIQASLCL